MDTKKIVSRFNKKANEWLVDLRLLDKEVIQIKPTEKSWSLAEVYDHVMRVSRSYQIPNLKKSVTESAERKKRKNKYGIAIFDFGYRKNVHIKMEGFPKPLVENFTPIKRDKDELVRDFLLFIKEVNDLQEILEKSSKENKQYHLMLGDINTKEWFSLIEFHIWLHDKQRNKIKKYLATNQLCVEC
jgi:hypothetical protein